MACPCLSFPTTGRFKKRRVWTSWHWRAQPWFCLSPTNSNKQVTRRRGRRRKKLLDDLGDRRGYSHLKEEALDRTKWRNRFGRGCGPVVWQITDDDDQTLRTPQRMRTRVKWERHYDIYLCLATDFGKISNFRPCNKFRDYKLTTCWPCEYFFLIPVSWE
jgi:hypothetical protein